MENTDFNNRVGTIIKNYREQTDTCISVSDFAKNCNLSKSLIYALEKHNYSGNLCYDNITKIANCMNMIPDELMQKVNNTSDAIIIYKGDAIYELVKKIQTLDSENIMMLHSLIEKIK